MSSTSLDPPVIDHALEVTVPFGTFIGGKAMYACLPGYNMNGDAVIECQPNQRWLTAPKCNGMFAKCQTNCESSAGVLCIVSCYTMTLKSGAVIICSATNKKLCHSWCC